MSQRREKAEDPVGFKPTISLSRGEVILLDINFSSLVVETLTKVITMLELVRDKAQFSNIEQITVKDGEQSQEKNTPGEYVGVFLSSANIFPK